MDSVIGAVKARLDIVEVVSGYVQLKKAGRLYRGLCPFHDEKTPSFVVDPKGQRFNCYGCGAHGDAIDFLQAVNGWDFKRALEYTADLAGVPLDRPLSREERDCLRREEEAKKERRRCRELARKASLEAERGLPKPRKPEDLAAFDLIYETKDKLDRGAEWVEDPLTLKAYVSGLAAWRKRALCALKGGGSGRARGDSPPEDAGVGFAQQGKG
ncbi:MAG: hypothetical protein H5T73_11510 [Actinobacteria bacterium]|nr:hypothetical protein [Actinomycetota bacterium]